jgi:hypothetical protein
MVKLGHILLTSPYNSENALATLLGITVESFFIIRPENPKKFTKRIREAL